LAVYDHVVPESPLQTPSSYSDLQSLTKLPKIAIAYAYGIRPDHLDDPNHPDFFWNQRPNEFAAVGAIRLDQDVPLVPPANVAAQHAAEVRRRVDRDQEVLFSNVVGVTSVTELPQFDIRDIDGSLDAAAKRLVDDGVALRNQ
jgi:hypothetical protein